MSKTIKHIAITGNLGSGKSTVCKFFEQLDIPVYYSDSEAKKLMISDIKLINQIKNLLGKESYEKGQLNKVFVGSRIFEDKKLLKKMNALVHPIVRKDYIKWRKKQNTLFTIQESALTFEIQAEKIMDATILVYAPEELLIERGVLRGQQDRKQIIDRLAKQMDQEIKKERATFIINNSLGELLIPQVIEIYNKVISNTN